MTLIRVTHNRPQQLDSPRKASRQDKAPTEILKEWILENEYNPYPSPAQKEELMGKTGLSRSQLDHWFTNARQRYVRPRNRRGPNPNYSRYPQRVTQILVDWLTDPEHVDNPYPTLDQQADLMKQTNLTKRQLQNWFTNARKRSLASRIRMGTAGSRVMPQFKSSSSSSTESKCSEVIEKSFKSKKSSATVLLMQKDSVTDCEVSSVGSGKRKIRSTSEEEMEPEPSAEKRPVVSDQTDTNAAQVKQLNKLTELQHYPLQIRNSILPSSNPSIQPRLNSTQHDVIHQQSSRLGGRPNAPRTPQPVRDAGPSPVGQQYPQSSLQMDYIAGRTQMRNSLATPLGRSGHFSVGHHQGAPLGWNHNHFVQHGYAFHNKGLLPPGQPPPQFAHMFMTQQQQMPPHWPMNCSLPNPMYESQHAFHTGGPAESTNVPPTSATQKWQHQQAYRQHPMRPSIPSALGSTPHKQSSSAVSNHERTSPEAAARLMVELGSRVAS